MRTSAVFSVVALTLVSPGRGVSAEPRSRPREAYGVEDAVFEYVEIGNRGAVDGQAERQLAGVGKSHDPERVIGRERHDRHKLKRRRAERVEPSR